jgi:DNA-binding NarL/FixJ family response regulator
MIRVALVDDQAIVRAGLARILSPPDGFDVVAECVGGHEAVERLPALRPEVILMDIRMPGLDGIAATARLRAAAPSSPVLVLTTFGEDEVLWGAIEAGAAGFVLKDSSAEDLISAVRAVAGGGAWFDPGSRLACSTATAGSLRLRPATRPGCTCSPIASTTCCA